MEDRVQKILAHAGVASRRACEAMIRERRVTVNGRVVKLGEKADPKRDHIEVDGAPVAVVAPTPVYVAVNKPRGVLSTTSDDRGRPTVRDLVPLPGHLYLVGRLDRSSEGLVLLTNDGELTNHFTHPRYRHSKEYRVLLQGLLSDIDLERWRRGVKLDGKQTAPANVTLLGHEEDHTWIKVVLREGRNRQIRRVGDLLGFPVVRLIRVRIGPVHLGDLRPRRWRHVTKRELGLLKAQIAGERA